VTGMGIGAGTARSGALWLGRRLGRLTLGQLADRIGGVDYTTTGAAVSRFSRRLAKERKLAAVMARLVKQLSNVDFAEEPPFSKMAAARVKITQKISLTIAL